MTPGEQVIFIDHKGTSHKAVVTFDLGDDRVCLEYGYKDGQRQKADNVPHIDHPSKQENNPDFPSYPLYAWKRVDEEHLELPTDHPVLDPVFQYREFRDGKEYSHNKEGDLVERKRPHYDAHVRLHRQGRLLPDRVMSKVDEIADGAVVAMIPPPMLQIGHPAHPETVRFPFGCAGCGKLVQRVANHQGGKQWEPKPGAQDTGVNLGGDNRDAWQEHVCSPRPPESHISDAPPAKPEHELWCAFFNTGKECSCKGEHSDES